MTPETVRGTRRLVWDMCPGVPAAGHLTRGGWWHPGAADGCVKCEIPKCDTKEEK